MIEIRALKNDDNLNDLVPLSKEFFWNMKFIIVIFLKLTG